ncbi:Protein Ycf2 (chloroplast) [Pinus thunbergii] [Rhizoctonia solani]|uniref:Protein Ycf2 (Chloroplast) [Pinus thunbergii] n=1 Tax=Rhizoctonia solani TaxID=456999 RepID=A0A0K6G0G3_9AGAM|nr:Protein Ycf2 (chloroplast) [Pinus thunbergii] [Rhizoctonia solani]
MGDRRIFRPSARGIKSHVTIGGRLKAIFTSNCLICDGEDAKIDKPEELQGKYLELPSFFGVTGTGYVINCVDLINRVDDSHMDQALRPDFDNPHPRVTISFWDIEGYPIPDTDIQESRLGKVLHEIIDNFPAASIDQLMSAYRDEWVQCLSFAISVSNQKAPGYTRNPFNRFYQVPKHARKLLIYISPGPCLGLNSSIQSLVLEQAIKDASESDRRVCAKLISTEEAESNTLVHLSTNPLGLYRTWIARKDLKRLVLSQGPKKESLKKFIRWARQPPKKEQHQIHNEYLKKTGYTVSEGGWSLLQYPGQIFQYYKRRSTQTVMGESANKWLHMIAHRFMPNVGDHFDNLIFGTKECNTDMMRAEAAVEQLLYSGKVSVVDIHVNVQRNLKWVDIPDRYSSTTGTFASRIESTWSATNECPGWLALQINYKILWYLPYDNPEGYVLHRPWTAQFHPFSSQCPLFFEYTLDRAVLEGYLKHYSNLLEPVFKHSFGGYINMDEDADDENDEEFVPPDEKEEPDDSESDTCSESELEDQFEGTASRFSTKKRTKNEEKELRKTKEKIRQPQYGLDYDAVAFDLSNGMILRNVNARA